MLPVLTCILFSFFLPASCQFSSNPDAFSPDGLTAGLFAVLCIFSLLYGLMAIWTIVALIGLRGHRSPYGLLIPTILFLSWSNAAYMVVLILDNIPSLNGSSFYGSDLPVLLMPSFGFVSNLLYDWGTVLQFLVIVAVLWDRESALRKATEGKSGGRHWIFTAVHATLATLTFIFGTASEAFGMDTNVKLSQSLRFTRREYFHRLLVRQQLDYVFNTFAILMTIDVAVTTFFLWRKWKKAGISDKITNLFLYVLVPLYSVYGLVLMIFVILFSPSGISRSAKYSVFEGAYLAFAILVTGISIAILIFILSLSVKKALWGDVGETLKPTQQHWAPQGQHYVYASPPQVPQAGYYSSAPQWQEPQPAFYGQFPSMQMYPASPPLQPADSASAHQSISTQGQFPQPMYSPPAPSESAAHQGYVGHGQQYESTPGSYSPPPASAHVQSPVQHHPGTPEKMGLL
ncbi:hypothetical protein R3P38DRAFT_2970535 [Favolaschia claudopus]|uniref:Uncharacterized protein n=1 Tax=Favolaschia claudopus TaxID=2862362 RepID=A0AAW0B2A7_9AGAR